MPRRTLELVFLIYLYAYCCDCTAGFSVRTTGHHCTFRTSMVKGSRKPTEGGRRGRGNNHSRRPRWQRNTARLYASSAAPTNGERGAAAPMDEAPEDALDEPSTASPFWPSNKKPRAPPAAAVLNEASEEEDGTYHECDYYDAVFDSIVKIYATHNFEPDMTMPWQKSHSYTSTSSGFVIDDRQILTNAHSVEYAGQVMVRRRGSSKKYRARVGIVANECDLAILNIDDEEFWTTNFDESDDDDEDDEEEEESSDTNKEPSNETGNDEAREEAEAEAEAEEEAYDAILPLEFGELPQLQDEVEVLGYPTGGDSLSVTKGVVSRIEATEYAQCSGSYLLAIQIDAAINGGNSGGPVVDATTGKVIGVAFQSLEKAENIGYVIPVTVVLHFLEDICRNGRFSGNVCLGIRYLNLENESIRAFLKLPKEATAKSKKGKGSQNNLAAKGGVMVRSIFPTSPCREVLRENDVILSIDGIPIANDGMIPFRRNGRERVDFGTYIQTKFADDTVEMDLWRDGGPTKVDVPLTISKELVPQHFCNEAPPYLIVGGLVFTVLSYPYLEDSGVWGDYVSEKLSYLSQKIHEPLEREGDQVVILINVLAHPKNTGYDNFMDMELSACNGVKVRSLKHFQELLQKEEEKGDDDDQEEFLRLEFSSNGGGGGGKMVVLETKSLPEIDKEVREEYSIQSSFYFPPHLS